MKSATYFRGMETNLKSVMRDYLDRISSKLEQVGWPSKVYKGYGNPIQITRFGCDWFALYTLKQIGKADKRSSDIATIQQIQLALAPDDRDKTQVIEGVDTAELFPLEFLKPTQKTSVISDLDLADDRGGPVC